MAESTIPDCLHRVYAYMDERKEEFQWGLRDKKSIVWMGHVTKLSKELEISYARAYRSTGQLEIFGCIQKLKHGTRTAPSIFEIKKSPTNHLIELNKERTIAAETLLIPTQRERLADSVNKMANRLNQVEDRLERLETKYGRLDVR